MSARAVSSEGLASSKGEPVAQGEGQEKKDSSKGFAGLSSMVSDVDSTVAQPTRDSRAAATHTHGSSSAVDPHASAPEREVSSRPPYQASAPPRGGASTGMWILGVGAVAGLIWLVSQSGERSSSTSPVYTSNTDSLSVSSPSPTWQPAPSPPPAPTRPIEEKPPTGTNNVLTAAQLRYCVAEEIRLDAAREVINNDTNLHVDRFNGIVEDYNSRCGKFRYRGSSLASAKAEIERFRSTLESDGRAKFARGKSALSQNSTIVLDEPTPDPMVMAVQKRLNDLGYDAGPADGLAGAKTRAAISAYLKANNLPQNGKVSGSLLQNLEQPSQARQSEPNDTAVVADGRATSPPATIQPPAASVVPPPPISSRPEQFGSPDLSIANPTEQAAIERSCDSTRRVMGPGAYYDCLKRELSSLRSAGGRPDLSIANPTEQAAIERSCDSTRRVMGPGAYYDCLRREMSQIGYR